MFVAAAITVLGTACSNPASSSPSISTRTEIQGKLGKYSSPYEVGDIVFNDGSATPYTAQLTLTDEQKSAAIALIFYKGTGLNSGNDTTTSRTLGVGLKHSNDKLIWCKDLSNAYKTDITTIQCPATSKAYSNDLTFPFTGDRNGSDNFEQIKAFLKESGLDDDPSQFVNSVFEFTKNYSSTATNLGTSYASGWYLPSCAELFQIYACRADTTNGFDIDAASETLGGDKFDSNVYWSSSQSDRSYKCAYKLLFETGNLENRWPKNNKLYACCVREF